MNDLLTSDRPITLRIIHGIRSNEEECMAAAMRCDHKLYEMEQLKNVFYCERCDNYFFWDKEHDDRVAKKSMRKAEDDRRE